MIKPPRISIPKITKILEDKRSDNDISSDFSDDFCQIVACLNIMKDYCGYCDGQFCVKHIFNIDHEWCKKTNVCVLCEDKYEVEEEEYNNKMRNKIIMNFVIAITLISLISLILYLYI